MLSRLGMAYRPSRPVPSPRWRGLQLAGRPIEARTRWRSGDVDPCVDGRRRPPSLGGRPGPGGGGRAAEGSALEVEGAEISAVRREAGLLEVRVYNPSEHPTTVSTAGRSGYLVDLRGRRSSGSTGSFNLRPFGIATFRLPGV